MEDVGKKIASLTAGSINPYTTSNIGIYILFYIYLLAIEYSTPF